MLCTKFTVRGMSPAEARASLIKSRSACIQADCCPGQSGTGVAVAVARGVKVAVGEDVGSGVLVAVGVGVFVGSEVGVDVGGSVGRVTGVSVLVEVDKGL